MIRTIINLTFITVLIMICYFNVRFILHNNNEMWETLNENYVHAKWYVWIDTKHYINQWINWEPAISITMSDLA